MITRLRNTTLAGGGALLLVLALSGVVAAASILTAIAAPVVDPTQPVDTTATFEDVNGNNIDDDCETTPVVADTTAADAANLAVDLNLDGVISVDEAAHSERTGGQNCNHGGYVSGVAGCDSAASADETDTETGDETKPADGTETDTGDAVVPAVAVTTTTTTTDVCAATDPTATDMTTETPKVCTAPVAPAVDATTTTVVPIVLTAHDVAQMKDAVGGKNCNHGGAVSAAAHASKDAAKAARDAAKLARMTEKATARAEKAAKIHKTHTKHGKGHAG